MNVRLRVKELALIIAILLVTAVILYPLFKSTVTPGWVEDAWHFMKSVGIGIERYKNTHDGKLPESLAELYPKYLDDIRITENPVEIGKCKKQMWLTYLKPKTRINPDVAIAELRLHPNDKTSYHRRGVVLNADLHVQ